MVTSTDAVAEEKRTTRPTTEFAVLVPLAVAEAVPEVGDAGGADSGLPAGALHAVSVSSTIKLTAVVVIFEGILRLPASQAG